MDMYLLKLHYLWLVPLSEGHIETFRVYLLFRLEFLVKVSRPYTPWTLRQFNKSSFSRSVKREILEARRSKNLEGSKGAYFVLWCIAPVTFERHKIYSWNFQHLYRSWSVNLSAQKNSITARELSIKDLCRENWFSTPPPSLLVRFCPYLAYTTPRLWLSTSSILTYKNCMNPWSGSVIATVLSIIIQRSL